MSSTSNGLSLVPFVLSAGALLAVDPGLNVAALDSIVCAAGMSIGAGKGVREGCGDVEGKEDGSFGEGLG